MSVIYKKNSFASLLFFFVALLSLVQRHSVNGSIVLTPDEGKCMKEIGQLFESAPAELKIVKYEFEASLEMEKTSAEKMYAKYPADVLKAYETYCTKYGGKMHIIPIDFFDCFFANGGAEVEVTLKNFANCMADVPECTGFNQEHVLQQAWAEYGLNCFLEEKERKTDPPKGEDNPIDDDIAKKEKEAAAEGADDVDKEEKNAEYIPEEEWDSDGKRKKKGRFMKFILFSSLCGVGYFVFDRYRKGYPIELPYAISSRLPFGGSGPSRFAMRPQTGFVSDYNLIGGEENTLQFSTEYA